MHEMLRRYFPCMMIFFIRTIRHYTWAADKSQIEKKIDESLLLCSVEIANVIRKMLSMFQYHIIILNYSVVWTRFFEAKKCYCFENDISWKALDTTASNSLTLLLNLSDIIKLIRSEKKSHSIELWWWRTICQKCRLRIRNRSWNHSNALNFCFVFGELYQITTIENIWIKRCKSVGVDVSMVLKYKTFAFCINTSTHLFMWKCGFADHYANSNVVLFSNVYKYFYLLHLLSQKYGTHMHNAHISYNLHSVQTER